MQQERVGVEPLCGLGGEFGQDARLGALENAVEAAQDGEGKDDFAVLGLLVVTAQQVGNRPDEGG